MTVADLTYPHRLLVLGGPRHWERVTVASTAPLGPDGISAFVRYEDEVATRFGYVVSRWSTEDADGLLVGVMVYSVQAAASARAPREHPSNGARFRVVLPEAEAVPEGSRRPTPPAPPGPALWARRDPRDVLVPVALGGSSGVTHVSLLGAGLVPQRTSLLLADPGLEERLSGSPTAVDAPVYSFTHRTREHVAARVAAGRGRPRATLTIGTLAQFGAAAGNG